tara:strand:+ start:119 stop:352 length:234 start_codon:yes stop_codon:yes gene_type:complete
MISIVKNSLILFSKRDGSIIMLTNKGIEAKLINSKKNITKFSRIIILNFVLSFPLKIGWTLENTFIVSNKLIESWDY